MARSRARTARSTVCRRRRRRPPRNCAESTVEAGTPLTLTATPAVPGTLVTWVYGCDPGDNENAATCLARPENRYIGVRFGDAPQQNLVPSTSRSICAWRSRPATALADRRPDRVRNEVRRPACTALRRASEADSRGRLRLPALFAGPERPARRSRRVCSTRGRSRPCARSSTQTLLLNQRTRHRHRLSRRRRRLHLLRHHLWSRRRNRLSRSSSRPAS